MEIRNNKNFLEIELNSKNTIYFNTTSKEVKIDDFSVSYPWEYEKSGILLEVKEYSWELFYSFSAEWNHILFVLADDFELKEEILSFFWDVDILFIYWTKKSAKIFENIEARVVIPFWPEKSLFLQTLWQNPEEVNSFKTKWEFSAETSEFVNFSE